MEFGGNNGNHNEMWEWRGEEYDLQRVSLDDVSHCLWGDVNQNVDDFLNILDEQTPIKDCADLSYQVSDIGDKSNKGLEESVESSQVKRRRMLQFTSESNEVTECSMMEDGLPDNVQWNSQWNFDFSDNQCSLNCEELVDQSSEGWLIDCLNESEAHCSSEEMNNSVASINHADVSGFYTISPETEADVVQEKPAPIRAKILKGRKSFIRAPPKLTTSIAYPFALIKPCGVHGDLTLSDINRRIHAPPLSKLMHNKEESDPYPTSAFSGKPVVVKTKIRTEGGKGSITIMRTRG